MLRDKDSDLTLAHLLGFEILGLHELMIYLRSRSDAHWAMEVTRGIHGLKPCGDHETSERNGEANNHERH